MTSPPPPPASPAPQEPPLELLTPEECQWFNQLVERGEMWLSKAIRKLLIDARRDLATTRTRVDKLQTFKDYVHKRLDDAGVGKHDDKECRIGGRLDDVLAARAENAGLREVVDKLPKTADGVPVIEGKDTVWHPKEPDVARGIAPFGAYAVSAPTEAELRRIPDRPVSECYSTREAALAARRQPEGKT